MVHLVVKHRLHVCSEVEEKKQESWRQEFENNKREIDFFADTLEIRRDAIQTYIDYKQVDFASNDTKKSNSIGDDSNTDDDDYDSEDEESEEDGSDEDDTIYLVSACPKCGDEKLCRNRSVEKIVKVFQQMMLYRNLLED